MDRLILEKTVWLEGRNWRGRKSTLVLDPVQHPDWLWRIDGHDVPIVPGIMHSMRRRVALKWNSRVLNEFEHIGILRAAGLRGVRVSLLGSDWPPYDGCSLGLWQAVIPHVHQDGTLRPFGIPRHAVYQLPGNKARSVSYAGDGNDYNVLRMTGIIDFKGLGVHRFGHMYPDADLRPLVRARTLGWPALWQLPARAASLFGWPHPDNIVWPGGAPAKEVLEETGRHRMLDMLAILNFAAPADHYLAGSLHSCLGGHENDLGLLAKLGGAKVLSLRPAA